MKQISQQLQNNITRRCEGPASSHGNLWWLVLQKEFLVHLVARGKASTLAWTARGHEKRENPIRMLY